MQVTATGLGPNVMTASEASEELGYSYNTFIQEYKNWGIPSERIAGRTFFYKEDIAKFKAENASQRSTAAASDGPPLFRA